MLDMIVSQAESFEDHQVVQVLLAAGANPDLQDKDEDSNCTCTL